MRQIRRISRNPLSLGMVVFVMLLFSCGTEDYVNQDLKTSDLSGEEIFGQIFFLDKGGISSEIPAYAAAKKKLGSLSEEDKIVYSNFTRELTSTIKELDENFFDSFKANISSKDPLQIKEELKLGAELLKAVINAYLIKKNAEDVNDFLWKEIKANSYDLTSYKDIEKLTQNVSNAYTSKNSRINEESFPGSGETGASSEQNQCVAMVAVAVGVVAAVAWIAAAVSWVYLEVSFYGSE